MNHHTNNIKQPETSSSLLRLLQRSSLSEMEMRMRHMLAKIAFLGLLGMLAFGCAQQIGDIDRTNPNRLEKGAVDGEWYFQQTVVEVNATAFSSFVGYEGTMYRVEFDIEEDYLMVYQTHEAVPGTDAMNPAGFDHGQPVAAFPISSHFDVQRGYSSSTGEQTNVISENTSDRYWFERDYMRVDWTQNQVVTSVDWLIEIAHASDISISPQDMGDDITWFVDRDANGEVYYIDAVTTFVLEPEWIDCILEFGFPLYGGECGPETVTVRSSFMRIDDENTYIPREYSDYDMNEFGFFRTERSTYDQHYGARDEGRVYLANRWDIWEESLNADGTEIPYANRTPSPIVYYLSEHFPEDLLDEAFDIARMYDNAYRRVVAAHGGIDIPHNADNMADISLSDVPRMFYLCENPGGADGAWPLSNEGYANGHCERPGVAKNLGDLRYSSFNFINHPQQDGPLGYGPSSADPLTGELIAGNANVYGAALDTYAQYALDLSKLFTGELDPEEYGYGRNVEDYFDHVREQANGDVYWGRRADQIERYELMQAGAAELIAEPRTQAILDLEPTNFRRRYSDEMSPFELLEGTQLEARMVLPEVEERLTNLERVLGDTTVDAMRNEMSLTEMGDPSRMLSSYRDSLMRWMAHGPNESCIMRADFLDPAVYGIAQQLAQEREELLAQGYTTFEIDEMQWEFLRGLIYHGVATHELGHTIGLRHNFEASYDALNYFPTYWELREETFNTCDPEAITFNGGGFFTGQIAPELCDTTETVEQYEARNAALMEHLIEEGIHEYQYSSTMDYLAHFNSDWQGLGLWDYAAIAYAYGELVEVYETAPHQIYVEVVFEPDTDDFDYSNIYMSQHTITDFDDVDEYFIRRRNQIEGDDPAYMREEELGHEHSHEWYHYSVLPIMFGGDMSANYARDLVPMDNLGGRTRVPYRFCSDEYYGTSIECNIWDQGADYLEAFQDVENGWNEYYMTNFFRRGRAGWGLWLYPSLQRIYGRWMVPMVRFYQHWLIRASSRGYEWYGSEWGGYDTMMATMAATDFLANVVTTPTVGTYYFDEDLDMWMNIDEEIDYRAPFYFEEEENIDYANDYANIGLDQGRYGYEQLRRNEDDEAGYYYFLETEVMSWFWAKWTAMMAMVLPDADIMGADTASDSTAYSIPMYLIFDDELNTFFGALPREDFDIIGNCVVKNGGEGRDSNQVLSRNLASGAPQACNSSTSLNPYTEVYGNSDFNMRQLSILYGSAYFQSNYSPSWFDLSNVYILGRGYNIDPGEGFTFTTFEHDNGVQYAAVIPEVIEAGIDENIYIGAQLIYRANELTELRDAEFEVNGESSQYWSYHWDVENLVESMRLLGQANSLFEGYNVYLPFTL